MHVIICIAVRLRSFFFQFHEEGARIMVSTTVFPSITVIMKELLVATTESEHAMLRFRWQYNFTA